MSVYVCILAYAGWVIQQPQGTFTSAQHAVRMAPVFVSPALAYMWYQVMSVVFKALVKHTDKRIRTCQAKTEKILHGLKDAMRYDRTHALLSKYDPEYNDGLPDLKQRSALDGEPRQLAGDLSAKGGRMSLSKKVTAVAASTMGGAGIRLSGALTQLLSVAADTVIGDDPVLLNSLKVAESQAQMLEHENIELKHQNIELEKTIERYEEQFGLLYDVSLEPPLEGDGESDQHGSPLRKLDRDILDDDEEGAGEVQVIKNEENVMEEEEEDQEERPRRRTRSSRR